MGGDGRISHHGQHYPFEDVRITPKPVQRPIPAYVGLVLEALDRTRRAARLRADRGAVRRRHELRRLEAGGRSLPRDLRQAWQQAGPADVQLLHAFRRHPEQEAAQRARQIRYYKECVIPAFPGDPATAPPSYRYFIDIVDRLQKVKAEDLTENSVLLGSPAQITDTLKKVEAAGFAEVILYFNVGLKPHAQVKEEMDRFMREVAPAFDGAHSGARRDIAVP